MFRVLQKFSNQNTGLVIVFFVFFALFTTDSVESAQTRNSSKTKTTPAKKNAKATPTPNKKSQAKATPTPKKSTDKKGKTNSSAKSTDKTASKNKSSDKSKQASSKSDRSNQKTSAKQTKDKQTKDSRQNSNSRQNAKNTKSDSRRNEKNTKSDNSKNRRDSDNSKNRRESNKSSSSKTNSRNTSAQTSERKTAPERNTSNRTTSTNRTTPKTKSEASTKPDAELPQIIVTDVAARVRSQAQANAPELSRLRLGTVLKVTEKNPAWYKVQYISGGKTANGWISANSVNDLNSGAREELYRQIVDRNYKDEMDFAAASEMVEFLTQVSGELGGSNSSAELELKRLLALRAALKKIPSGQSERSPYKEFLKAQEKSIIYSDPAAEWYVASNLFWDLHKKYATTALADRIAWEAAENPLPGECEGYVNCNLFSERITNGEYLRLHPNGTHAAKALENLNFFLSVIVDGIKQKTPNDGPTDVTDRAEFNNLIAELRTIVSRLPSTEKEKTLQHLKQIAEAYR